MIKWLEKKKYFSLFLALLIIAEIFFFSSIPGVEIKTGNLNLSIAYHIIVFFLLNFFLLIAIHGEKKIKVKYIIFVITASLTFAILDEIHQIFVPFRNYDIKDILIDSIGIMISTLIYINYKKKPTEIL
jgi:VanZ family protein